MIQKHYYALPRNCAFNIRVVTHSGVAVALGAAAVELVVSADLILGAEHVGAVAQGREAHDVSHEGDHLGDLGRQVVRLGHTGDGHIALHGGAEQAELGLQHVVGGLDGHGHGHHVAEVVHTDILGGNA